MHSKSHVSMALKLGLFSFLVSVNCAAEAVAQTGGGGSTPQASGEKLMDTVSALRTRKAIGNIPGLASFVADRGGENVEYILDEQSRRLRFRTSMKNAWVSLSYQEQINKRRDESSIFGASFGTHLNLNKHNVLGAVFLVDGLQQDAFSGGADSTGWLVGAYLAGNQRKTKLTFDIAVLAGQSTSNLAPLGTYTDTVTADRILVAGQLSRTLETGPVRLTPSLRLKYAHETWPGYVDQVSNIFASRTFEFAEVRAQLKADYPLAKGSGAPRLSGTLSVTGLEEISPTARSTVYGTLELGLTVPTTQNSDLRISWKKDRIGDPVQTNTNLQLRLNLRF